MVGEREGVVGCLMELLECELLVLIHVNQDLRGTAGGGKLQGKGGMGGEGLLAASRNSSSVNLLSWLTSIRT